MSNDGIPNGEAAAPNMYGKLYDSDKVTSRDIYQLGLAERDFSQKIRARIVVLPTSEDLPPHSFHHRRTFSGMRIHGVAVLVLW